MVKGEEVKKVIVIILGFIFLITSVSLAKIGGTRSHSKEGGLREGCASCHRSHGKPGTMLLLEKPEKVDICFECHSLDASPEKRASDIKSVFMKRSRHPVLETSGYHFKGEELPEREPSVPRHVACVDCHEVHSVSDNKKTGEVYGINQSGLKKTYDVKGYEVCFKCHSDSENLPSTSINKRLEFDPDNPSAHPVIRVSKRSSPSIIPSLRLKTIECTDCHGNNDTYGPQGPHGSEYEGLLRYNYNLSDGAETPYAYELCYKCHNRDSILRNESFKGTPGATRPYGHKEHIVYSTTSCRTCHIPHGSFMNEYLIEFNEGVVQPNTHGLIQYINLGGGYARCYLTCHGYEHKEELIEPSQKLRK